MTTKCFHFPCAFRTASFQTSAYDIAVTICCSRSFLLSFCRCRYGRRRCCRRCCFVDVVVVVVVYRIMCICLNLITICIFSEWLMLCTHNFIFHRVLECSCVLFLVSFFSYFSCVFHSAFVYFSYVQWCDLVRSSSSIVVYEWIHKLVILRLWKYLCIFWLISSHTDRTFILQLNYICVILLILQFRVFDKLFETRV